MYLFYHWNAIYFSLLITAIILIIPILIATIFNVKEAIYTGYWNEDFWIPQALILGLGILPAIFWIAWGVTIYTPTNSIFDLHIKNKTLDVTYKNVSDCGKHYPDLYINYSTHEYFNIKVLLTDTTIITQLNVKYLSNNEIYNYYWLKG